MNELFETKMTNKNDEMWRSNIERDKLIKDLKKCELIKKWKKVGNSLII